MATLKSLVISVSLDVVKDKVTRLVGNDYQLFLRVVRVNNNMVRKYAKKNKKKLNIYFDDSKILTGSLRYK